MLLVFPRLLYHLLLQLMIQQYVIHVSITVKLPHTHTTRTCYAYITNKHMHADAGLSNYQCLPTRGWNEAAKGIDLDAMDRSARTHIHVALLRVAHIAGQDLITCIRVDVGTETMSTSRWASQRARERGRERERRMMIGVRGIIMSCSGTRIHLDHDANKTYVKESTCLSIYTNLNLQSITVFQQYL
jgi:hypothetical protein